MAARTSEKRETKTCLIQSDPFGSDGNFLDRITGLAGPDYPWCGGRIIRGLLGVEVLIGKILELSIQQVLICLIWSSYEESTSVSISELLSIRIGRSFFLMISLAPTSCSSLAHIVPISSSPLQG